MTRSLSITTIAFIVGIAAVGALLFLIPSLHLGLSALAQLVLGLAFWPVMIGLGVWLGMRFLLGAGPRGRLSISRAGPNESATEILNRRYALSEITQDQFLQMRQDIQS